MGFNLKKKLGLAFFATLFFVSVFVGVEYREELQNVVLEYGVFGMIMYVLIAILSTVFAPMNTLFLLPLAANIWGPLTTALLSITGWTIGAVIAYYLARTFGKPLVSRFVGTENLEKVQSAIPEKGLFLWLVIARMAVSVDILSYALGLFIIMPYTHYTLATIIGVTPFAFIFSYTSTLSPMYIVISLTLAALATLFGLYWMRKIIRTT